VVDEFQDTSPTQMRLIEQLTLGWQHDDGRTLFCVGDPMQSIYRFRKADVSLFLQASEFGIGQLPLTPLKLTRNNRSHPQVVDWINNTFKPIFPAQDNITQVAISYRTFIATKDTIADEGVSVHPLVLDSDEESEQARLIEARYVADLIAIEQKNNP
jgi:ATP-dependent exoDNAse (exonuclease V) beta subunit